MTSTIDEPFLDGMPEDPPAWVRPDRGVRMPALALEHLLAAALAHAGTDDELPYLMSISVDVADDTITTHATDRYSLIRERRPVTQTCEPFRFLLRSEDASSLRVLLRSVLRGLKDDARDLEPIDLALEQTDSGPTLRVLGQDLDVRFTEQGGAEFYPQTDPILDRALTTIGNGEVDVFDTHINPSLLGRVVALQKAGRLSSLFLFRKPPGKAPLVITTFDEQDDVVVAVMPINVGDEQVPA